MINQNSIKNLLQNKNMTQKSLAEQLGLDPINFNKIVNNKRGIDHQLAKKIADILGVQWFQVYEPMNTQIDLHGTFDGSQIDCKINMFDPIKDKKYPPVILKNYIANAEDIICILDVGVHSVFIMLKNRIDTDLSLNGLYYAKLKNGDVKFLLKNPHGLRVLNPNVPVSEKTFRQKPKLEYVIPVSRIDFDYVWVDNGKIIENEPYPIINSRGVD